MDVITGGSPCQDLSVAGKRAGLQGERSGLFLHQIRIIKEMRENARQHGYTDRAVGRYSVWENVPGCQSSNSGRDFQAVLTEFVRIADPCADYVPMPKKGKWPKAGCLYGVGADGNPFSVAWRQHDAQYWGVPQRRKRVCVLCDYAGYTAAEILFDPEYRREAENEEHNKTEPNPGTEPASEVQPLTEGLRRNTAESRTQGERVAGRTGESVDSSKCFRKKAHPVNETLPQNWESTTISDTLNAFDNCDIRTPILIVENAQNETVALPIEGNGSRDSHRGNGYGKPGDPSFTLNSVEHHAVAVFENHSQDSRYNPLGDVCETVSSKYGTGGNNQPIVVGVAVDFRHGSESEDATNTLQHKGTSGWSLNYQDCVRTGSVVRRLTPLECTRLQGYPDGWVDIGEWTDGKGRIHKDSDSAKYRALGNSIALPFWEYIARRICAQYERPVTIGSLFDGIGGFPLVFERCGAKAVWASEIEEFCIAVTKKHFPDEDECLGDG